MFEVSEVNKSLCRMPGTPGVCLLTMQGGLIMEKIRIGSIGIGNISRGVHLPGIAQSPDMELVAVCDIRPEALKYAQETYGIDDQHCFTDYESLIACEDVDVVDITLPNHLHFPAAMAAVRAGKPYILEKPVTLNAQEAETLAKATAEAGLKNMVCFSYRYQPAARYIRDLIRQGVLGRIFHVDIQYYQAWGLPKFNTARVWRFNKAETGSGALGDLGSHALDLVRFVTGEEVERVIGHLNTFTAMRPSLETGELIPADVDDFSNYMADLTGGIAANFRITRFAYGRGNYQRMEIYGEKGAFVYTLDESGDGVNTLDVCLDPLGSENHQFQRVTIPQRYYAKQMQCFADLYNDKGDGLNATIEDGLINMKAVDQVIRSGECGKWLDID